MILNPNFYLHHGHRGDLDDSPPPLLSRPAFSHQAPVGFSYSAPPHPPFQQSFAPSYPLQGPSYAQQQQPFMPQYRQPPPQQRSIHPSLLNDPAFSPDPRSNPYYFSMNDREEIYPASLSDSLSDYASTAPDDESEVDHTNLPPRMRMAMLQSPDSNPQPLPQHPRSQSEPYAYPPIAPSDQSLARSHSTRVIPVPPPISRASASNAPGGFRLPSQDPRQRSVVVPSQVYASSAFVAPRDLWQPPPPYSDSESGSSSSSPNQTPASSSSHLPRDAQKSSSSLPPASAYPPEKYSPPAAQQPPSPTGPSSSQAQAQAPPRTSPVSDNKTSSVQSTATRPPITPRNASAPDLHPPPPPTELPPRPSTVPIATPSAGSVSAPVAQRKRSKNTSVSTAPRDLDKIDELDESDPLGFAWHHGGPYEAIAKAAPALYPEQSISGQKRAEPPKRKPVQYDSTALGVAPGQIFPANSQYQPPSQRELAQLQQQAENMPPGSPLPSSPLMQVPVRRRVPPSGVLPSSPLLYNNTHMGQMQAQQQQQQASRMQQQPPAPIHSQRSRHEEAPQPSPPLPNPYSPAASRFPQGVQERCNSPPHTREPSVPPGRPDLPPSSAVPRPDIALPPRQQTKPSTSLLPRHLPKKLVMPTPLQQLPQPNQQMPDSRGAAHVEVLAQRHVSQPPPATTPSSRSSAPSMQSQPSQQHARAQDIPMSHGPKVLRKRHTTGGVPLPMPMPMAQGAEIPASNTTAALFAARVRFAEPPKEETKEERKRREKEQARREKEREKMGKVRPQQQQQQPSSGLGGLFGRDQVKEAELAREREAARAQASAKASGGRKLSKRR